ncbi:hypothetical protein KIW84_012951 [Lathyrus oleraceus]|uniref:DUF7745 domain-containing protein n=1 Tax=Pisum sativum TaxID=3888 RepID=A0A9D5GX14_PEA|nr:hypothetical protein KIW84_012951 [Pisum sativum]
MQPNSYSSRYNNLDFHVTALHHMMLHSYHLTHVYLFLGVYISFLIRSGFSGSLKMDIGRKRHVAYKFPVVCLEPIQQLMKLMDQDSLEGFRKDYGLILSFITVLSKDQHDALFTLLQFYDPPLRCFTFPDYILVPTLEKVASFLRVPIKPQLLFYSSEFLPDLNMVASATYLGKSVLKANMCQKGEVNGFHLSFLLGEAKKKLEDGDQRGFNAVLALCVYGIVLFPNVAKFVDVDAIRLFVLGNPVSTLLGDFFHSVHHRNENRRGGLVNCYIIHSCGNFPNVPLVGRRGSINYNPSLAVRQFGYALRTPPLEKDVEESLSFHSSSDLTVSRKEAEAWLKVIKRGRTVLGKVDCRTYPQYEEWLQGRVEEFGLPFPIEEPLYPPTPEQSTMVSREEYDKLKNAMEELQTENLELSVKLQDCMHQFHEAEYQKGEAVRLQGEAERKLVVELTDALGKLAGWQEQWDTFSASRKVKEEEMVAELTGQMEKLKILLKEKNNELLCARSTNGYITDQLNKAQGQIEELKVLAGLKKSRLEEKFIHNSVFLHFLSDVRLESRGIADSGIHQYGTRKNQQRVMESFQADLAEIRTNMAQFVSMMQGVVQGQEELQALVQRQETVTPPVGQNLLEGTPVDDAAVTNPVNNHANGDELHGIRINGQPIITEAANARATRAPVHHPSHLVDKQEDMFTIPSDDDEFGKAEERDRKVDALAEKIRAMECQNSLGFDVSNMSLVDGLRIPYKFKAPSFDKYNGTSCPRTHLQAYYRKMSAYTDDEKMWMYFFQDNLSGASLDCRTQLQSLFQKTGESFKEYAQRWRELAARVQPPMLERELTDMFIGTLQGVFMDRMGSCPFGSFSDVVICGERTESLIKAGKIQDPGSSSSSSAKKPFSEAPRRREGETNAICNQRNRGQQYRQVAAVTIPATQPQQP